MIIAGLGCGVFIARAPSDDVAILALRRERATNDVLRVEYEAQLRRSRALFEQVQSSLLIEQASRSELEKTLSKTQSELDYVRDQLAFFEELLPAGPVGSIRLRAVDLDRDESGLSYRVLLMRSGKGVDVFCGSLQFVATGIQDNKSNISVPLKPLKVDDQGNGVAGAMILSRQVPVEDALKLEFEQFQRSQGYLVLPDGFEPKYVTVRVLRGSIVLATRRVDL